jgi:phosphatidylserine decarboxylase
MAGKVVKIEGDGKQLPKEMRVGDYALKKMAPFQKITTISTEIGDVVVRQITSFFAKRIEVFIKEGEILERGQRLGRILAGSTIVIELPSSVDILVKEEQNVLGGESIIAKY